MINKEEYPTSLADIQKDMASLWFDDTVSPGDIKATIQPKHRTDQFRFNTDGMFSDHTTDILVTVVYNAYLKTGDISLVVELYNLLCESDKKILCAFLDKCAAKGKMCIKIINVYNSITLLREYSVLIIEDAIQFYKELKRLRRRSSTKTNNNYYFFSGGAAHASL